MSGVSSDDYVTNSEVIDLYDTGVTCKPWPDLPVSTNGAVGGFINEHLLICGGATPTGLTSICHAMTPLLITDNLFDLSIASYNSAGVVFDTGVSSGIRTVVCDVATCDVTDWNSSRSFSN